MSYEYIKSLVERRQHAWARAQDIMNRAAAESRDLTAEEQADLDATDAALTRYKQEEERLVRMQSAAESSGGFRGEPERIERGGLRGEPKTDGERLAAMLRGELRSFEARGAAGFDVRALQSAGGTAIPTTFYDQVTVYLRTDNPIYQVATVLDTPDGHSIVLPRLTADPAHGGTVTAEATGINELDPTISSVQLDAYKYAIVTLWSRELDTDNVINLQDLIARASARELTLDMGDHFATGSGSGQPNGFITAASNGGTANGTALGASSWTFFGPHDLVDLFYGRAAGYRTNGSWMMSTTAITKARKFRDNNNQFIWDPSLVAGQPDRFLGRPVYENPSMAAVASASKSVAFGDFSRYFIRRLPLRVEVSDEYKFSADQRAIKVVERTDGDLVDTAAIAYLVSANT